MLVPAVNLLQDEQATPIGPSISAQQHAPSYPCMHLRLEPPLQCPEMAYTNPEVWLKSQCHVLIGMVPRSMSLPLLEPQQAWPKPRAAPSLILHSTYTSGGQARALCASPCIHASVKEPTAVHPRNLLVLHPQACTNTGLESAKRAVLPESGNTAQHLTPGFKCCINHARRSTQAQ